MKLKMIFNKIHIDYINKKSKKLLKNKLFRISILLFFISTPFIFIKLNTIHPELIRLCDELSKEEKNSFTARRAFINCKREIKSVNRVIRNFTIGKIKKECSKIEYFEELHVELLKNKSLKYNGASFYKAPGSPNPDRDLSRKIREYKNYSELPYLNDLAKKKIKWGFNEYNGDPLESIEVVGTEIVGGSSYNQKTCEKEILEKYKNREIWIDNYTDEGRENWRLFL